jgi:Tol biopolymer transport system component
MSHCSRSPAVTIAVLGFGACQAPVPDTEPQLHYVTTAHQLGPVGYRDPLGVISPDGEWLAYSVQHHVYLQRIGGGPATELPPGSGRVVHLTWTGDGTRIVMDRQGASPRWWAYHVGSAEYGPLWPAGQGISAGEAGRSVPADQVRQLAFAPDGLRVAGIVTADTGTELWTFPLDAGSGTVTARPHRLSFPAWNRDGGVACLLFDGVRQTVSFPCGTVATSTDLPEAYGGIAFAPDGRTLYTGVPNSSGTLDFWSRPVVGAGGTRLSNFDRDAYAPSAARDGSVLFKVQTYRTFVGDIPAGGGPVRQLATFQSETPSYDPSGAWIGVTYGTWRRVVDDFRYPDIAQDVGLIPAAGPPARRPAHVVDSSVSEDQGMGWSPNGKWIAYHSHKEAGDDIWLVPADRSAPARRITTFGRGYETGWPRWSPDGRWVVFDADSRDGGPRHSVIWVMGVDQGTGAVTVPEVEVALDGFTGEGLHAEWLPGSDRLVVHGFEEPDRHVLLEVARGGGRVRVIHRWISEHRHSGFGLSPDGRWLVFPAPADGVFQLFRVPAAGGSPEQLTFDPGHKTQPAYSPDGRRIALTVWEYQVQFWVLGQSSGR